MPESPFLDRFSEDKYTMADAISVVVQECDATLHY